MLITFYDRQTSPSTFSASFLITPLQTPHIIKLHPITCFSSNSSCNFIALVLCIVCSLYLKCQSLLFQTNADLLCKISEWIKKEREKGGKIGKEKEKEIYMFSFQYLILLSSGWGSRIGFLITHLVINLINIY